jgi:hypothetical protein
MGSLDHLVFFLPPVIRRKSRELPASAVHRLTFNKATCERNGIVDRLTVLVISVRACYRSRWKRDGRGRLFLLCDDVKSGTISCTLFGSGPIYISRPRSLLHDLGYALT